MKFIIDVFVCDVTYSTWLDGFAMLQAKWMNGFKGFSKLLFAKFWSDDEPSAIIEGWFVVIGQPYSKKLLIAALDIFLIRK